jgi:hypothetical protein
MKIHQIILERRVESEAEAACLPTETGNDLDADSARLDC